MKLYSLKGYKNKNSQIKTQCLKCKSIESVVVDKLTQNKGCKRCVKAAMVDRTRLKIEEVARSFKKVKLRLLAKTYVNSQEKLKCVCLRCGRHMLISTGNVSNGKSCRVCSGKSNADRKRTPYVEVRKQFNAQGLQLVSKKYENNASRLKCRCVRCGESYVKSLCQIQKKFKEFKCPITL